jgi:uncharacterized membrane protein
MGKLNKAITVVLLIIIVSLISAIIYLSVTPQPGDRFTEFYILNSQGKAADYPDRISAGEAATIILGVINHEGRATVYNTQIITGGAIIKSVETGILSNNQKWENKVDFKLNTVGGKQRVEFYLYTDNKTTPHIKDPLVLIVDVIQPK